MENLFKYLKIAYIASIFVIILAFIACFLYTEKHNPMLKYVVLERWAIIFTLCGIFASLKYLHPKVKQSASCDLMQASKRYVSKFVLRLTALAAIFTFNLGSYVITGSKNFIFLAFITIFAFFFCAPNKMDIQSEDTDDTDDPDDSDKDLNETIK